MGRRSGTRTVQGCARVLQGLIGLFTALCKAIQGLQGLSLLSRAVEKKKFIVGIFFFPVYINNGPNPCNP